jgi:cobalt-zinc-cadmium efflux system membrane fusion protein
MKKKVLLTVKEKMLSLGIKHKVFLIAAIVFLVLGIIVGRTSNSCKHLVNDDHADHLNHNGENEHTEHDGHGHQTADVTCNEDRLSDLEEVMCEHQVRIIDCDNCRFEVGAVKIDPSIAKSLIQTGVVENIERKNVLKFTGQVQLDRTRTVDVVSTCGGRVDQVSKLLGEKVEKGDILAVIHSADLGQVKADFLEVQAKLELTQATFRREKELYEKKITSEADYLNALNELKAAEASYAATDKRLHLFGLETDQIGSIKDEKGNGDFADLVLRAPQSGTIIAQNISAGKMVETTESLYTIADLSNLWAWCDVYEKDLAVLHEQFAQGQLLKAIVQVKAFAGNEFEGVVDLVGNLMDEHTRTVKIRVQVKNLEGKLRPGMFAEVEVMIPGEGRMTAVLRNAIMSDAGENFLFQHWKEDLWVRMDVTVGSIHGDFAEILSGVPTGATIVTSGAFMLKSDILREKMGAGCAD